MANELRVRTNFVGGLVEDSPLTAVATTLTSASLANLPVIDSTNHAAVIIDPDGVGGNAEIVWVTAHTASATTATILRGQEGTTAREHYADTPWVHTSTQADYEKFYVEKPATTTTRSSTTLGSLSTPLSVTVNGVMPGQAVELKAYISARCAANEVLYAAIFDGTNIVQRTPFLTSDSGTSTNQVCISYTDIAPAANMTYEVYVASNSGSQVTVDDGVGALDTTTGLTAAGCTELTATLRWRS